MNDETDIRDLPGLVPFTKERKKAFLEQVLSEGLPTIEGFTFIHADGTVERLARKGHIKAEVFQDLVFPGLANSGKH